MEKRLIEQVAQYRACFRGKCLTYIIWYWAVVPSHAESRLEGTFCTTAKS